MAGRIRIEPYKPLGIGTQAVLGGGYINVDASTGQFRPSPLAQFGLQSAEGAVGIAVAVSEHLARDNEAIVKGADARLGEAEQALLFDPQNGYLNLQGPEALNQAPAVFDAYREAQAREMAALLDDDQRRMMQGLTERRLASFSIQVERHSAAERLRWYDTAGEQRIAQMRIDAGLNWSDDALLRRALGTTRAEVRDKAERHGWEPALTEAALRQETSRTLVSAIGAAVDRDPERAQALRTRYAAAIEDQDRTTIDALLSEAQTRQRAEVATTEILNATPPDSTQPAPQWCLCQAEAITDPAVRVATIRRLKSAGAAHEARARALAEQILAQVLKNGLTDSWQIPLREWVALDAERRQAIEALLDHNARGDEPPSNPMLFDALATQVTREPQTFARRDLVPSIAHLPLPQWQHFRRLQAGIRCNDPATQDELYAIKRGLQLVAKMLPTDTVDGTAADYRAELVEEIDTWCRINGKSPSDAEITGMLERNLVLAAFIPSTLGANPYHPIVEKNVNPPWPLALELLFARGGHHFIPQAVYKRLRLSEEALKVFRDATSGPLMPRDHQNDAAHRKYSDAVAKEVDRWLERKGIDPKTPMNAAQARDLLQHILNSKNEVIRSYMKMILASKFRYAARYGSKGTE